MSGFEWKASETHKTSLAAARASPYFHHVPSRNFLSMTSTIHRQCSIPLTRRAKRATKGAEVRMTRSIFRLAAFAAALGVAPARADTVQAVSDRAFSLSMRTGVLHTNDGLVDSTWVRPVMLGGTAWIVRARRRYLNGLQFYGMVGLESASMSYSETAAEYEDGLAGIHRADIDIDSGLTYGIGARLSLYDDGRFHVSGFADAALPAGRSKVTVNTLLIDLNGLRIDVAKAVRDDASVT